MAVTPIKLDYGSTDASKTGRQGSETQFPSQFLLDYHNTFGGPFTMNDIMNMAPRAHSLFGYGDQGQVRPGGGFNLGFGAPTAQSQSLFAGEPTDTGTKGNLASGVSGSGGGTYAGRPYSNVDTPTTSPGPRHTMAELSAAYQNDPEKVMDLQRFFQQAHLNPNDFTLSQYQIELGRAKQYGFSGRSAGNLSDAFTYLQRAEQGSSTFGGGKGSGIF